MYRIHIYGDFASLLLEGFPSMHSAASHAAQIARTKASLSDGLAFWDVLSVSGSVIMSGEIRNRSFLIAKKGGKSK